ncbi:MAG: DUF177 domain-containing protein [Rhodobacteraceae bacterium]|nr:DUF177 domain-containing protein [Paracoccaceae bacterium]
MLQFPVFRVADLPQNKATPFEVIPGEPELRDIANELGLQGLRKLRFKGEIRGYGKKDWQLTAQLGATVTQACVVTLDPVNTRIEAKVERKFLSQYEDPTDEEFEMPEDDSVEPLGAEISIEDVLIESLSLNIPPYPRKDGVELGSSVFTEPGKKAMTDDETKPFAGLAALKDQLGEDK